MFKHRSRLFLLTVLFLCMTVPALISGCGNVELGEFSPAAPHNLLAVASVGTDGTERAVLVWSPSEGTTPSQGATFNVYRGKTRTGTLADKTRIATGIPGTTFIDTPAVGTWYYQVTAVIYGEESGPSNEASFTVAKQDQTASFSLTGTSASGANTLTWTAVSGAAQYVVLRGLNPSGATADVRKSFDVPSGATSFTDTTGVVGTTYYYQILAKFSNGQSLLSNEIPLTTR